MVNILALGASDSGSESQCPDQSILVKFSGERVCSLAPPSAGLRSHFFLYFGIKSNGWTKKSAGIGRANGGLRRKIRIKSPQRATSEASAYLLPKTLNVSYGRGAETRTRDLPDVTSGRSTTPIGDRGFEPRISWSQTKRLTIRPVPVILIVALYISYP